jgi:hypothetical protein
MKNLLKIFLFVGAFSLYSSSAWGQNEKFKALFIYNFTKYIEWPAQNGSFVITVFGETPMSIELHLIAQVKKVGSQSIEVRKAATINDIGESQIIYVPSSKNKSLADVSRRFAGKAVLIVTDESIDKGHVCINFVVRDGKQSFEISKANIESHRLRINSGLMALGIAL